MRFLDVFVNLRRHFGVIAFHRPCHDDTVKFEVVIVHVEAVCSCDRPRRIVLISLGVHGTICLLLRLP